VPEKSNDDIDAQLQPIASLALIIMATIPPLDTDAVLELDGYLKPDIPNIARRYDLFRKWKDTINVTEGGYDSFTKGYEKFGLNANPDGSVTYREWAPNAIEAVLIGEFSTC
jgi:1,4-alpha-glucan branching enzyme